ncbi:MAG: glucuronate isomerase [Reinekea sp.]
MSAEDGLVMQIHVGSRRNHNQQIYRRFGRDMGADIPTAAEFTHNLQTLLDHFGNQSGLSIIRVDHQHDPDVESRTTGLGYRDGPDV